MRGDHAGPAPGVREAMEVRGFALYVGVDTSSLSSSSELRRIVAELQSVLSRLAPASETYASLAVAPVGRGGRSLDVVRETLEARAWRGGDTAPRRAAERCGVVVDLSRSAVYLDGCPAHLTYTEFEILRLLVQLEGRTVDRLEIIDALWRGRRGPVPSERTVDVHVRRLRHKLGGYEGIVRTARGSGYRFDPHADVLVLPARRVAPAAG